MKETFYRPTGHYYIDEHGRTFYGYAPVKLSWFQRLIYQLIIWIQ